MTCLARRILLCRFASIGSKRIPFAVRPGSDMVRAAGSFASGEGGIPHFSPNSDLLINLSFLKVTAMLPPSSFFHT
jgi:hypothetical protein